MEAASSSLVKHPTRRLNLGNIDTESLKVIKAPQDYKGPKIIQTYDKAVVACAAQRLPPLSPEEVERRLQTELKFTGKGDIPVVASLYRTFFESTAVHAKRFDFSGLAWGAKELTQLADVFPKYCSCEELSLSGNNLDATALAGPLDALLGKSSTLMLLKCSAHDFEPLSSI